MYDIENTTTENTETPKATPPKATRPANSDEAHAMGLSLITTGHKAWFSEKKALPMAFDKPDNRVAQQVFACIARDGGYTPDYKARIYGKYSVNFATIKGEAFGIALAYGGKAYADDKQHIAYVVDCKHVPSFSFAGFGAELRKASKANKAALKVELKRDRDAAKSARTNAE